MEVGQNGQVGQVSDLSVYILASSDGRVGHLSVRLVRLKSDSDTSPRIFALYGTAYGVRYVLYYVLLDMTYVCIVYCSMVY